jgi:hypothetical protein
VTVVWASAFTASTPESIGHCSCNLPDNRSYPHVMRRDHGKAALPLPTGYSGSCLYR